MFIVVDRWGRERFGDGQGRCSCTFAFAIGRFGGDVVEGAEVLVEGVGACKGLAAV